VTIAELALLSLIVEEPRHGYAIRAVIDERGVREWVDLGMSSIYHVLNRLEQAGMIQGRAGTESGGPSRKVFRPTRKGRRALAAGIREALAVPRRAGSPFLLGLANLPVLPPDGALAALDERTAALRQEHDRLADMRSGLAGVPPHVDAMFGYTQSLITAEIHWLEAFRKELP
jgi:DNA-binding PadR family transcriptional regulator